MKTPPARSFAALTALGVVAVIIARRRRPAPALGIVEPEQVQVGASVTITGFGFVPDEIVEVRWGRAGDVLANAPTDAEGLVSVRATIPDAVNGAHAVTITGVASRISATATCRIKSSLVIDEGTFLPGESVSFSAHGMRSEERYEVRCAKNATDSYPVLFDQQSDAIGSVRGSFAAPDGPAGNYVVSLIGANGTRASAYLQVKLPATGARPTDDRAIPEMTTAETGVQPGIATTGAYPDIADAPSAAAD